ncbi:serine hydrolase domain-containing protein [Naasia sp. SYSU D00948]|uniref:serine hydrolase domain-containing protein n=1 Tax=Naasia sp. SYSU D00948 TaxID=2817379 RepID=UPI001B3021FF|nr:serine hydrolase domain-containing protein [Naasia sp. SYSU D00948]
MSSSPARAAAPSVGALASGYEELRTLAERIRVADPERGFHLVVHDRRGTVADLASNDEFRTLLQPVASVSKGMAGIVVGLLVERGQLDPALPVAEYWPEFAEGGKGGMTIAELLSHRAGLLGFSPSLSWAEAIGEAGPADLAAQTPVWARGAGHGYHAWTIGTLVDELVRRITGSRTAELFDAELRRERGIDFWLRIPDAQRGRLRRIRPSGASGDAVLTRSLSDLATAPFEWLDDEEVWLNSAKVLDAGVSSVSGVGTARGIADAYAAAIGADGSDALLSDRTVARISQLHSAGDDLVLAKHTRFALLFEKPWPGLDFGTARAFGHDGAGGALGFADPVTGIAFGYVTDTVPSPGGADPRALAFAEAVRRIALSRV